MSLAKVLIPLPAKDFDPTECAIPWRILSEHGVQIEFATPEGQPAVCDQRMLTGKGLGPLAPLMAADARAGKAYAQLEKAQEFVSPIRWETIIPKSYDAILLPGGHAPGMKEYLESKVLQRVIGDFFALEKIVGAICHGVVLVARSELNGISVLKEKETTSLLKSQELLAWGLTAAWLGSYYRTYPQTVEDEVKSQLFRPELQFKSGPLPLLRDHSERLERGYTVRDSNYLSARWPGDAHKFAYDFLDMLKIK